MAKESKAVKESQAPTTSTALTKIGGFTGTLMQAPGDFDESKFERLNLPPMVPPEEIPIGSVIIATVEKFIPSPVSTIKGNLIWLRHKSGAEFTIPCTGVIRAALAPGRLDADSVKEREELLEKLNNDYKGRELYIQRLADKEGKKGSKKMYMFDIRVSK